MTPTKDDLPGPPAPSFRKSTNWSVIAKVAALLFTFFGLCFGSMSWFIETKNAAMRDALDQRRQLADEREAFALMKLTDASGALELAKHQLDSLILRETAFQTQVFQLTENLDRQHTENLRIRKALASAQTTAKEKANAIDDLSRRLDAIASAKQQLEMLLAESKRSQADAQIQKESIRRPLTLEEKTIP